MQIIRKIEDMECFSEFSLRIKSIVSEYSGEALDLERLHTVIDSKEVNEVRLRFFDAINSIENWPDIILRSVGYEFLVSLLGPDLAIQSKLNVSIQMPMDETSILDTHSDSWSADTPYQLNLWIPLTRAYSTNSMFIFSEDQTIDVVEKMLLFGISGGGSPSQIIPKPQASDFVELNYGNLLVFNPALLHGNVLNETDSTRVSLNVRVKSLFAPEPGDRNSDRRFGAYYRLLKEGPNTKFARRYLLTGILK